MKPDTAKKRREERERVLRCENFPYFLQNEMLIFSLAHCFQLISITLFFSLSSKNKFDDIRHDVHIHILLALSSMRKEKWGDCKNGRLSSHYFPSIFHNI
jgi:hypothetical protein